jgi:hypothetical protein
MPAVMKFRPVSEPAADTRAGSPCRRLTMPQLLAHSSAALHDGQVGNGGRGLRRARSIWRRALIASAVVVLALGGATAWLFIWPAQGMPTRVSAIVMLDGPGDVLSAAVRLATEHHAPFLVVSRGSRASGDPCPRRVPAVRLICFTPRPPTTQGEAEFVGQLARKYRWRSVAVVAITPQDTRARLRLERCFTGRVYVVTAPIPLASWPYQIAYEWGALVKALVLQSKC